MAIKINGSTIIDDSRKGVNFDSVGIGTTNPDTPLHLQSNNPILKFTDANQATDNKSWNITAGQTQLLRIQAINDAGAGGGSLFDFYRSGNNVNELRGMNAGNYWFIVNNTNNRVGIGTTNPIEALDVQGTVHISRAASSFSPHLELFAENTFGAQITAKSEIDFPNLIFRAESGGAGPEYFSGVVNEQLSNGDYKSGLKLLDNKSLIFGTGGDAFVAYDPTPGVLEIKTVVAEPITVYTNDTERLRVHSAGQVSIGTTIVGHTPADDFTIGNSGDAGITIRSGTSDQGSIFFSDGTSGTSQYRGAVQYNHNTDILSFRSFGTEKLKLGYDYLTAEGCDLNLTSIQGSSAAGPTIKLQRNSSTPADEDYLGQIKFSGESDADVERDYAKIIGKISDASNTTEDGILEFIHIKAGTATTTGRWKSTELELLNDTGLIVSGIVTASSYRGDGSQLTGVEAASFLFNTGITSSVSTVATGVGSTILTLPSTGGHKYIIHSILASNIAVGNTEVNFVGAFDFDGGERSYFAHQIPVPTGTSVEMLKQPQVLNPSDKIIVRSTDFDRVGANDIIDVYVSYEEKTSADLIGIGIGTVGLGVTATTTIYTSSTYPSVVQSIRLVNKVDTGPKIASVSISNGVSTTFLVDNLIVPKYGSVEILDNPKSIQTNDVVQVQLEEGASINVQLSAKKITS